MKRRILAVFCVMLSCILIFAGCGGNSDNPGNNPGGNTDDDKEYELPLADGCKQVTVYYNRAAGYTNCDLWLWADGVLDGAGYAFHECEYGGKAIVNVPDTLTEVGFIIRLNCPPGSTSWDGVTKDGTESDRKISLTGDYTVIYTKSGDANSYSSNDGGKTLEIIRFLSMADMQDTTHIKVTLSDSTKITKDKVTVKKADGTEVAVSSVSADNVLTFATPLDLANSYTVTVEEFGSKPVVPMTYFDSKAFANEYNYDGELGAIYSSKETTFRLWAPTAASVKLNLYAAGNGGTPYKEVPLAKGEKGTWQTTVEGDLDGKYYTYTVNTSAGVNEVVDPYARSAGLNGQRGMVLDLDKTDPEGWSNTPFDSGIENYTDAEIWEVHVRDFSNKITNSQYKGKYLAFTETGLKNANGISVGVDYLKNLGITHVHLLPSFDYASVDESKDGGFNWGYDPQNYNVPEGSYSTDASDGYKRVTEYKQMVKALHDNGIGVIMDVVYNHTYSSDSNFQKIVPYYYYRFNANGTFSNGSGCGNETASDRAMMRKFIVESVSYWQSEYNLDGFRFDLMALHDLTTLQNVEKTVHTVNPKAMIYGEGWTGGTSTLDTSEQATLANLTKLNSDLEGRKGIAMFNDVIRDGVKGSVFNIDDTGFANGAKEGSINSILFGVAGSVYVPGGGTNSWYSGGPTQVVNYVSAHDNNTLWDRICHVHGEGSDTLSTRLAMNRLSAAIVQTSLGIPFMQAGEEMLRQKKNADGTYNENSYNSSDEVNNIRWDLLKDGSEQLAMMQYYKGLIEFRKSSDVLRMVNAGGKGTIPRAVVVDANSKGKGAFVAVTITKRATGEKLLVIYNGNNNAVDYTLPDGNWNLYIDGTRAGATVLENGVSGAQSIAAISCYVYKLA
ncbi:MAG: type I pullulanase [Clostridia bacterium]|nr:type I pullulanase [Clostridia bacterium]